MPGIREVSFVKIDTEGHEEVIVPALESFFRQKRPTVLVSLHPMFLGHRRVQKVVQLLQRIFPYLYEVPCFIFPLHREVFLIVKQHLARIL